MSTSRICRGFLCHLVMKVGKSCPRGFQSKVFRAHNLIVKYNYSTGSNNLL